MQNKKPMLKETVGSLYVAFNTPDSNGKFDLKTYEETIKSDVVKNIKTTENADSTTVRASGVDYTTISKNQSIEQAVEVIAFDPETIAKMRKDQITTYLIKSGAGGERPFFAFGKVVKKTGGEIEYAWYPKCQLVDNTDDINTSEENFSEQNDTLTIKAYAFDDEGNKSVKVNSGMQNFPEGLTEEMFFTKPVTTDAEIEALITPGT